MKVLIQKRDQSNTPADLTDIREILSGAGSENILETEEEDEFYINENADEYRLEIFVPGFRKENFNIGVDDDGIMTVQAREQISALIGYGNTHEEDFYFEDYSRSFVLPEDADEQEIEVYYEEGILSIMIPKK